MPYEIKWEPRGVYTKFWGDVSTKQIEEASVTIRSNPLVRGINYSISCFIDAEGFTVSRFEALLIAAHDHEVIDENPDLKIAIVATEGLIAELAQTYATSPLMAENAKVFFSLEDTRKWV